MCVYICGMCGYVRVCCWCACSHVQQKGVIHSSLYLWQYRRLDIYVVPYSQFPLTLLHFTGSGHFNRSMRHKADKLVSLLHVAVPFYLSLTLSSFSTQGMSLSEYALCTGVIRKVGTACLVTYYQKCTHSSLWHTEWSEDL